jgi:hypothetical protein
VVNSPSDVVEDGMTLEVSSNSCLRTRLEKNPAGVRNANFHADFMTIMLSMETENKKSCLIGEGLPSHFL